MSPVGLGVMADSRAWSSKANPNASRSGGSEVRKGYDKKRNASRSFYLKLLKGEERLKMNTPSKQTRMSPSFSLTIVFSKYIMLRIIFILFCNSLFLLFSALYTFLSSAPSVVMFLVMQRLKQKQCGHCPVNQPHIVKRPEFLNQF